MDVFIGAEHERFVAEMCLRAAFKKLKVGDVYLAVKRTEDALRSLKVLQEIKKAN
ncbi:hypothetical protein [Sporosarcina sp. NPDC096371]|uniref:hypothetical protein n=1 Tax=Sporosarcina sp. NPDC096371 TaxID=3364530 RepID=UPI00380DAE2B